MSESDVSSPKSLREGDEDLQLICHEDKKHVDSNQKVETTEI